MRSSARCWFWSLRAFYFSTFAIDLKRAFLSFSRIQTFLIWKQRAPGAQIRPSQWFNSCGKSSFSKEKSIRVSISPKAKAPSLLRYSAFHLLRILQILGMKYLLHLSSVLQGSAPRVRVFFFLSCKHWFH